MVEEFLAPTGAQGDRLSAAAAGYYAQNGSKRVSLKRELKRELTRELKRELKKELKKELKIWSLREH